VKDIAERLEAVVRRQLDHIETASQSGRPLEDEEWEAVAHMARVVRTLAVHQIKDEVERAPELSHEEIARALRALVDKKL
jgi:hypothetical protein